MTVDGDPTLAGSDTDDEHYLRRELYELIRTDPKIFDFLQEGSLDGLWYWDITQPENEWMNPRFKQLFGYEDHEVPDLSSWWMERIHPDDLGLALENYERHRDDPSHPYDQVVRYTHKDGSTVWVRCRGIAVRDENGEAVRLLGCHNDVTALKLAEAELEHRNRDLRDALRTAQLANNELERFAGSVAHDLRNPLTVVHGFAQFIAERVDEPDLQEMVAAIVRNVDRSLKMITDLLDFATTVGSEEDDEVVDLSEVVAWVIDALEMPIALAEADIQVDDLPVIHARSSALRQIFLNLVDNAIKYRSTTQPAEIRISSRSAGSGAVEITVVDNGIGIPPDERSAIFQLGSRVGGQRSDRTEGSGVGLATCQALVHRLGGSIRASAGPAGIGTTMSIDLPVSLDRATLAAPARTVMVVDDDPDAIALAEVVLEESGATLVAQASSAAHAIETYLLLELPPRLLIVGLDLGPGGTGLDVLRTVRQIDPLQQVVLRAPHLDHGSIAHAERLGAAACVAKRSTDDLRAVVERFCD